MSFLQSRNATWLLAISLAFLASSLAVQPAQARNTRYLLKVETVRQDPRYNETVPTDVAFYFAGQSHPAVTQSFGEVVTNRKGNSFGRSDEEACRWTMMAALKVLHDNAIEQGGNAVIDIVSYYKKIVYSDPSTYECHAGAFVSGVALKGTVVKLAQ
jgi:hypothetical protein